MNWLKICTHFAGKFSNDSFCIIVSSVVTEPSTREPSALSTARFLKFPELFLHSDSTMRWHFVNLYPKNGPCHMSLVSCKISRVPTAFPSGSCLHSQGCLKINGPPFSRKKTMQSINGKSSNFPSLFPLMAINFAI